MRPIVCFVYQLEVYFPFKWYAHSLTLERENHTYGQRYSLGLLCLFDTTSFPCHGSYGICTVDSAAPSRNWAWVLPVAIIGTRFRIPAGATAEYVHVAPGQSSGILEEWVSIVTALEHCLPTNVNWTERRGRPCLWNKSDRGLTRGKSVIIVCVSVLLKIHLTANSWFKHQKKRVSVHIKEGMLCVGGLENSLCKNNTQIRPSHNVMESGATCQRMHLKTYLRPESLSIISTMFFSLSLVFVEPAWTKPKP